MLGFWVSSPSRDRGESFGHALEDVVHEILALILLLVVVDALQVVIGAAEIGAELVVSIAERVAGLAHRCTRRAL